MQAEHALLRHLQSPAATVHRQKGEREHSRRNAAVVCVSHLAGSQRRVAEFGECLLGGVRRGARLKETPGPYLYAVAPTLARSVKHWIYALGGLGFIPLGLLDNSVIPLPGSMDILIVFLSARRQELWLYYASMATLGSVIGGYITYRLARKGGKVALIRRFPPRKLKRAYDIFSRWGFGAIALPALLPPPLPMVPFLVAAGTMQYPLRKFLSALTLGRTLRYTVLAFLAARYGREILAFIARRSYPAFFIIMTLIVTAAAALFLIFIGKKQHRPHG
jgi:membrane protein YqaA with SNARE-associated domain